MRRGGSAARTLSIFMKGNRQISGQTRMHAEHVPRFAQEFVVEQVASETRTQLQSAAIRGAFRCAFAVSRHAQEKACQTRAALAADEGWIGRLRAASPYGLAVLPAQNGVENAGRPCKLNLRRGPISADPASSTTPN